jgi:hypothetical protein
MTNELRMILLYLSGSSIILHLCYLIFRKKSFGHSIHKLSKKEKLNFRIYGELSPKGEKNIHGYTRPIVELLRNSAAVSSNIDIKFKKRSDTLECEINFVGNEMVSSVLRSDDVMNFKRDFLSFQEFLEGKGSDITLINQFNSKGIAESSGIFFSISH